MTRLPIRCLLVALLAIAINSTSGGSVAVQAQERPELVIQDGHSASVTSVSFSPGGRIIASAGFDQTVKLWDA